LIIDAKALIESGEINHTADQQNRKAFFYLPHGAGCPRSVPMNKKGWGLFSPQP
jgi:hypothetical protein